MASNKLEEIEARLAAAEARCHLLTQALAAVLQQRPNEYRTEIITTAARELAGERAA